MRGMGGRNAGKVSSGSAVPGAPWDPQFSYHIELLGTPLFGTQYATCLWLDFFDEVSKKNKNIKYYKEINGSAEGPDPPVYAYGLC